MSRKNSKNDLLKRLGVLAPNIKKIDTAAIKYGGKQTSVYF